MQWDKDFLRNRERNWNLFIIFALRNVREAGYGHYNEQEIPKYWVITRTLWQHLHLERRGGGVSG